VKPSKALQLHRDEIRQLVSRGFGLGHIANPGASAASALGNALGGLIS